MLSFTRNLFARKLTTIRGNRAIRKPAPRANLEVTSLEDRLVPSTITGFSFAEQQGFPTPSVPVAIPGISATALTTILKDTIDQTWHAIQSGQQQVGPAGNQVTLQQEVINNIQQNAGVQKVTAYNIGESFASSGNYSAQLITSGANPTVAIQYHLGGNTIDFTTTNNLGLGSYANPTFHVSYDLTLNINVAFPTTLSTTATVTSSASAVSSNVLTTSQNVAVFAGDLIGKNITTGISSGIGAHPQDLTSSVDPSLVKLNGLLHYAAGNGYTHLLVGLDGSGNLLLTGQQPNLVVNAGVNDSVVVNSAADGSVLVTASGQTASFAPGFVQTIAINVGLGQNSVRILSVPAGVKVSVSGTGAGTESVTVGNGSLASVGGPVSVSNNSGSMALTIDDSADSANRVATVTNSAVQFTGLSKVSYSGNVTALQVLGGSGNDSFYVNSTAAGTPLSVVTGAGQNWVTVGYGSLAGIAGAVNVQHNNASGSTSLTVDDYMETGRSALINSGGVVFGGVAAVTYGGIDALTVVGAQGFNTIQVDSVPPGVPVTIYNTQHNYVYGAAAWQVAQQSSLPLGDTFLTGGWNPFISFN